MCTCNSAINTVSKKFSYKNKSYNSITCNSCGFVQTKPVEDSNIDIYETGHYRVKSYFIIPFLINLPDYIYIWLILLQNGIVKTKDLLDLGCGKGYFLYFLKNMGFKKLSGVETSKSRAAFARDLVKTKISSDFYYGGKIIDQTFNCITMIHVLEHIEKPFDFLDKLISDAVNDNGTLFIEVPNVESFSSKISGVSWAHFTPHFHTNHFTPLSFKNYCKSRNYKGKLAGTFSLYNSSMGMTSAILTLFGYEGSLFEDLKNKNLFIIISYVVLFPITLLLEIIVSFLFSKGSVIKFIITK